MSEAVRDASTGGVRASPFRRPFSSGTLWLIPLLSAALLGAGCGAEDAAAEDTTAIRGEPRLLSVVAEPVAAVDSFETQRSYQGQVEPRRRSQIGFDLAGTVVEIAVDEGDSVAKGALLARIDRARLLARQKQAQAAIDEARTRVALAESTLQRVERAFDRNAVAPQEVDEARRGRDAAEAALANALAQLELVEVELEKSLLWAPYRAVVAARHVDEGQVVAPGAPVLELVEVDRPRVRIGLPAAVARELASDLGKDSGPSALEIEVAGRTLEGRRLALSPQQSGSTRTVDLLLELDEQLGDLRAGEAARLSLRRTSVVSGFRLPVSALTESQRGLWSCLVAVPEEGGAHRLEQRPLEVVEIESGSELEGPAALVRGALATGDLVVLEGLQRLVPGQRVRVSSPEPAREPLVDSGAAS